MQDRFSGFRIFFYVGLLIYLFAIAIYWIFVISTTEEVQLVSLDLMLSFAYLVIGFIFYMTNFPEKKFRNYYV